MQKSMFKLLFGVVGILAVQMVLMAASAFATAPVVTIYSPSATTNYPGQNVYINFTAPGATSTQCSFDGGTYVTCSSNSTHQYPSGGSHTLAVKATNAANEVGTATRTFTIDPPVVAISTPANGSLSASPTATLNFTTTESAASSSNGGTGVFTSVCKLDTGAATACSGSKTYTGLADGSHTITVTTTDDASFVGSKSTTFTVDTTPPSITIYSPTTSTPYPGMNVYYSYVVTGNTGGVTCSFDGGSPLSCGSNFSHTPPGGAGAHTVSVTAVDAAGNVATATRSYTIDPPILTISSPANGSTVANNHPSITFAAVESASSTSNGDDGTFTYTCKLDSNAGTACTSPFATSGLAHGSHTIRVSASGSIFDAPSVTSTFIVP